MDQGTLPTHFERWKYGLELVSTYSARKRQSHWFCLLGLLALFVVSFCSFESECIYLTHFVVCVVFLVVQARPPQPCKKL